jgi:GxxExxY protein
MDRQIIDLNKPDTEIITKNKYTLTDNEMKLFQLLQTISNNVYKSIGPGLSEAIYHNGIEADLRNANIEYDTEFPISIKHNDRIVGFCRGDILIDGKNIRCPGKYIIELKAIRSLKIEHVSQLKAYLRHTNMDVGFLINFPYPDGDNSEVLFIHQKYGHIDLK